jgi:hypothetical protein
MMDPEAAGNPPELQAIHIQLDGLLKPCGSLATWFGHRRGSGAARLTPHPLPARTREAVFDLITYLVAHRALVMHPSTVLHHQASRHSHTRLALDKDSTVIYIGVTQLLAAGD